MSWLSRVAWRGTVPDPRDITHCSGYWHVAGNTKHDLSHYLDTIPATCRMIAGSNLRLYYSDPDVREIYESEAARNGVRFTAVRRDLDDLPQREWADRLVECCGSMELEEEGRPTDFKREKALKHYWRDYVDSGEDIYRSLLTIWLSKISLVHEAVRADPTTGTRFYAWIDASASRFAGADESWTFVGHRLPLRAVGHFGTDMRMNGETLPLSASYLAAPAPLWEPLRDAFLDALARAAREPYAHDEETVLSRVHRAQPRLFRQIGHYPIVQAGEDRPALADGLRRLGSRVARGLRRLVAGGSGPE